MKRLYWPVFMLCLLIPDAFATDLPKCLFVSSYHQGYAWSDGVQQGLERALKGKCQLKQFDMDTKRHKTEQDKRNAAERARQVIAAYTPDVVIAADDNAARYLIKPFYRDAELPFVFCGVNWSVDAYGFPYRNVTGMVEVAPLKPMLQRAAELSGGKRFFYLGANTATERKNLERFTKMAERLGFAISQALVDSQADWLAAYRKAQGADFIAIGSYAGIADWDFARVQAVIAKDSQKLTVTSHQWMMPVSMLGFTKIAAEQGQWAAEAALAIIDGVPPIDIPIVANRKWDLWLNQKLFALTDIRLPATLAAKAKRMD